MPFKRVPGFPGKIYVPEEQDRKLKKHDCKDCFACQMCSDDRCKYCLKKEDCCKKNNDSKN